MSDEEHISDLRRLVQHVALNESGWWDQAVERLILACSFTLGSSSREDLGEMVVESCGIQPNSDRVASTIERLTAAGQLIDFGGLLHVSEETREALAQHEAAILTSEQQVRDRFDAVALERGLDHRVDELWSIMETEVVLPIVQNMGAKLYGLLTSSQSNENGDLESHMANFVETHGDEVRTLLAEFLDPGDPNVRGFVLRRLNAQYAVDAAALPEDALERLSQLDHKASRVDVFLDTNFLFSVLGLHENPGDDMANELVRLVNELKGIVDLRLYALPETIEETRRVLRDVIVRLSDFRGQPNLAEAARRTTSVGLASRYFEAARQSSTFLTADDFFGPYESDLVTVLRSKSVELYNADLSDLHVAQDVVDDVHDQQAVQQKFRQRGPKSYEANLHDMVLWHFAKSRRGAVVESPLEVTAWVTTLDYGLIGFDRHKRLGTSEPPVCLEPSSLIQLFQFWVPSSTELDEALVGSIRQPLLFLKFDSQSEQVTLRILGQLSRFDGAADLEPDVVSEILTNAALRNRLTGNSGDNSADEQIVREEMVDVLRTLGEELADLRTGQAESRDVIANLEDRVATAEASTDAEELRAGRSEAELALTEEAESRAQTENRRLAATTVGLESRLDDLQEQNQELQRHIKNRKASWRFGISVASAILLSGVVLVLGGITLDRWIRPTPAWVGGASGGALTLLFGLELAAKRTRFQESRPMALVSLLRRWWWAFLLAIATSIIAGWIIGD